jgi:hypothetical protein
MKIITKIEERLQEINNEVMHLVEDQQMDLTTKNQKMHPLVDEKKILDQTLNELKAVENRDYRGLCSGKM